MGPQSLDQLGMEVPLWPVGAGPGQGIWEEVEPAGQMIYQQNCLIFVSQQQNFVGQIEQNVGFGGPLFVEDGHHSGVV